MLYSFCSGHHCRRCTHGSFSFYNRVNTEALAKRDQLMNALAYSAFVTGLTFFSCLSNYLQPLSKNSFSLWSPEVSVALALVSFLSIAYLQGIAQEIGYQSY